MKIDALRKLAISSIRRPWHMDGYDEDTIYTTHDVPVCVVMDHGDTDKLIVAAANHFNALLAVAVAADSVCRSKGHSQELEDELAASLDRLELID